MSIDTVGNFLTAIRNGIMASKKAVTVPYSRLKYQMSSLLKEEGFIKDFMIEQDDRGHDRIKILLKYVRGESVIHEIKRISKPGRRMYSSLAHIAPVIGGLGISILTTHRGVITHKQAKELGVGGEVLCSVW
jgi:small subunit ribosomal protein S8